MAAGISSPILSYLSPAVEARFWSKVERRGSDECWPFAGHHTRKGYARFKVASYESRHANRVAWVITHRVEPDPTMVVRHTCDNPPCCNPAHLLIGTHQDNANDKMERGRWRGGDHKGTRNPRCLLTKDQLREIIEAFPHQNNQRIAARFPIGHSMVSKIRTGAAWQAEAAELGWPPAIERLPTPRLEAPSAVPSDRCPQCAGKGCPDCDWFGTRSSAVEVCRG